MELELKHIQHYELSGDNGLKFKHENNTEPIQLDSILFKCEWNFTFTDNKGNPDVGLFSQIKPILLPMSSLYTEMEDGKVPAIELAKIANPKTTWTLQPDCNFPLSNIGELFAWTIDENEFYFHLEWKDYSKHYFNQLGCFQYLFENHFDIYGLIDKGLALDKTKIK